MNGQGSIVRDASLPPGPCRAACAVGAGAYTLVMHHLMFWSICGIWGTAFYLMRLASAHFGPIGVGGWRLAGGAVVLALVWRMWGRPWPLGRADLPALGLVCVCGYMWPFVLQPYLIGRHDNSSFFGMMVCLVPLLTILVSVPLLGVWPTRRQLAGVLGALALMGLLVREAGAIAIPPGDVLLAATVPLAYAISNTYVKRRFPRVAPVALVGSVSALCAMVLVPASAALEPVHPQPLDGLAVAIGSLVVLGVIGTGLATAMFYRLIQHRGPLFAGMVTYIIPLVALAVGWLGREPITPMQFGALVGILGFVALVQSEPRPSAAPAPLREV